MRSDLFLPLALLALAGLTPGATGADSDATVEFALRVFQGDPKGKKADVKVDS
jgi:hypothetical protein